VIRAEEISEGSGKMIRIANHEIAVFKRSGELCAIENVCPHEGGQLSKGRMEGDEVVCPIHGYRFHIKTGACSTAPGLKAKTFEVSKHGEAFKINLQTE
jgi:nitrite reductase/ring-hydroxylating ferredoxin subunit